MRDVGLMKGYILCIAVNWKVIVPKVFGTTLKVLSASAPSINYLICMQAVLLSGRVGG